MCWGIVAEILLAGGANNYYLRSVAILLFDHVTKSVPNVNVLLLFKTECPFPLKFYRCVFGAYFSSSRSSTTKEEE